jgi:hypothetical protein
MAQYMLMCFQPDPEAFERDAPLSPALRELHQGLRDAGVLLDAQRLRHVDTATTVRVSEGGTEITDGPFAVTKEMLAGYYRVECADLDEALRIAARLAAEGGGGMEVRPMIPEAAWAPA